MVGRCIYVLVIPFRSFFSFVYSLDSIVAQSISQPSSLFFLCILFGQFHLHSCFKYNLESYDFQIYIFHLKFSGEIWKCIVNTYLIFDYPMGIAHKPHPPKELSLHFLSLLSIFSPKQHSWQKVRMFSFIPMLSTSRSVDSIFLFDIASTSLLESLPLLQSCSHQYYLAKPLPDVANGKAPCCHLNMFVSIAIE